MQRKNILFQTLPYKGAGVKDNKYKNKYYGKIFSPKLDPINILSQIPLTEAWRFFIDGPLQASDPDINEMSKSFTDKQKDLCITELLKKNPEWEDVFAEKKMSKSDEKLTFQQFCKKYRAWYSFECREKNYLADMCKLGALALSYTGELDIDLIKTFHLTGLSTTQDTCYSEIKYKETKKGEFRTTESRGYDMTINFATQEGIKELLEEMLQSPHLLLIIQETNEKLILSASNLKNKTAEQLIQLAERIYTCIQMYSEEDDKGVKLVSVFKATPVASVQQQIAAFQQQLIDNYNIAIKKAKTDKQKLRAILIFLKRSEHLHPFIDGNGRVFYMALPMFLFAKNKLSQSLLSDMNIISCYSIDQLIKKVQEGTQTLIGLSKGKAAFGVTTDELLESLTEEEQQYFHSALKPLEKFFKEAPTQEKNLITKP